VRARATRPGHGAASGAVTAVTFGPAADRRNAADRAHRGDLEGALGVIGALLGLSALLTATTIVPRLPLVPAVIGLAVAIAVLAACATVIAVRARPAPAQVQAPVQAPGAADRRTWTMPPIESLRPPARSAWRTLGLVVLRCYLLAAIIVLAVRAIQLTLGAG
jgi:hypothetical protein